MRTPALAAFLSACALGCGSAPPPAPPTPAGPPTTYSSGTPGEAYFPLVEGQLHQFRTVRYGESPDAEQGVLVLKASRRGPVEGALTGPGGRRTFRFLPDGIESVAPDGRRGYVLKLPLDAGSTWTGEHGGSTRVVASALRVTVEAGTFDGCVQTLEQRGGDKPLRITTTFCPTAGIVALEASSGAAVERAELSYLGPPIDLGPEGLRRLE